jgi:hypothetical protein
VSGVGANSCIFGFMKDDRYVVEGDEDVGEVMNL